MWVVSCSEGMFTTETTAVIAWWEDTKVLGGRGRESGCNEESNGSNCREMHFFSVKFVSS